MKIEVRYQSRGGNTKAVAEIMAKAVGANAEPIEVPIGGETDILFLGGGVYAFSLGDELKSFIKSLPGKVKRIAAFSTAMISDGAKKIIKCAKKNKIAVCEKTLPLKGFKKAAATEAEIKRITDFTNETINCDCMAKDNEK